jgi:exosortase/archaeosortase family protein
VRRGRVRAERRDAGDHSLGRRLLLWLYRLVSAAAAVVVAAAFFLQEERFREAEAWTIRLLLREDSPISQFHHGIFFPVKVSNSLYFGMRITEECTSALLIAPLFLIAGGLMISHWISVGRALSAAVVGGLIIFSMNELRFLAIAISTKYWHESGYQWTHVLLGTFITLVAVTSGLAVFAVVGFYGGRFSLAK